MAKWLQQSIYNRGVVSSSSIICKINRVCENLFSLFKRKKPKRSQVAFKVQSFDVSVIVKHFLKLQLHCAIYELRFYSNSLIHILSLSNSQNNVASIQKNRGNKSHRVIVALPFSEGGSSCRAAVAR